MKLISVSILLICLLTATFSQWILIVSFKINQNYIASNLCANRLNPKMHCNGHCFLNKQLNNEQKQQGTPNSNSKENTTIQLFAEESIQQDFTYSITKNQNYSFYKFGASQNFSFSIFQPPQV